MKLVEMMMAEQSTDSFPGLQTFLFGSPLYAQFVISDKWGEFGAVFRDDMNFRVDGYCPFCRRLSTFSRATDGATFNTAVWSHTIIPRKFLEQMLVVQCARNDRHRVSFLIRIQDLAVQKTGQYPSFADIANDESKEFREILSKEDSSELHKAIGLAAHGVGIGSFVYVRRIFERLIWKRFSEFKEYERWDEVGFAKLRMTEKILFLKSHLPKFLVDNSKIYSILSIGIHQLDEKACLAFFEVARRSIVIILREDQQKTRELAEKRELEELIKGYVPPTEDGDDDEN